MKLKFYGAKGLTVYEVPSFHEQVHNNMTARSIILLI